MNKIFRIVDINNGHCQITYRTRNATKESVYYCLQNYESDKVRLMRCTQDGEPSHEVTLNTHPYNIFERPKGDSKLEQIVRHWIETYVPKGIYV